MDWTKTFSIPKELNNRSDDHVSYKSTKPLHTGGTQYVTQEHDGAACYHDCMLVLSETEFWLRPNKRASLLSWDDFKIWIELCKTNGIMPPDATPSRDGEHNLLHIPRSNQNRHVVYAGLCCYRWAENQPGVAYATIKSLENQKELDFFQALHFGCIQRAYWLIHSFANIMSSAKKAGQPYSYSGGVDKNNLFIPYSLALAWFFRPGSDGKTQAEKLRTANNTLDTIVNTLDTHKIHGVSKEYFVKEEYLVLHPELTEFYQIPKENITNRLSKTIIKING